MNCPSLKATWVNGPAAAAYACAPPSVRAAVEWSYTLLDPVEQAAFRSRAMFVGGFDAEAACAVVPGISLAVLARLVDKSLVAVVPAAAGTMWETAPVKIDQAATIVDGLPHMRKLAGTRIYDHVLKHQLRRVLELGTYHGVSTCYLGAAVDEIDGHVTTIDRLSALDLEPNVNDLLEGTGLTDRVTTIFAENSFTWELKRMLESAAPRSSTSSSSTPDTPGTSPASRSSSSTGCSVPAAGSCLTT
jgi:hypothetical protein